jgi:hypothetical protein
MNFFKSAMNFFKSAVFEPDPWAVRPCGTEGTRPPRTVR